MLYPQQQNMPASLQEMYNSLMEDLEPLRQCDDPLLVIAEKGLSISRSAVEQLKQYVAKHRFETQEEEITFFKDVKPLFYSQLFYYDELFNLEIGKPKGGKKAVRKYYKRKLRGLKEFFQDNKSFYEYIRKKETYQDRAYFTRFTNESALLDVKLPDADQRFATSKDSVVAEILKNEMLQDILSTLLNNKDKKDTQRLADPEIQWTATLNAFYQLMPSLIKAGAINNGNITMSKFAEKCELFFNIDLKNMYRGIQENRIKKDPQAFLKLLLKVHQEYLDEADENPRYK